MATLVGYENSSKMPSDTDKEKALKAFTQIMEQIGGVAVNIDGLLCISEILEKSPDDFVSPRHT